MSSSAQNQPPVGSLQGLFQAAQAAPQQAGLSQAASEILIQNLTPATIAGAQGIGAEALSSDRAFLFVPVLDMTGSMYSHRQDVIEAYNRMLESLKESKQAEQILISAWTFNTQSYLLHGYTPLDYVAPLDEKTYNPDDQTALYDAIMDAITGVVAYGQELRNQGARTHITLVAFTDGYDNSSRHTAQQIKLIVEELLPQELYTFALVGFGGNFASQVAGEIGFPNVLAADADPSAIRHALEVVSTSLIRASQTRIATTSTNTFFS